MVLKDKFCFDAVMMRKPLLSELSQTLEALGSKYILLAHTFFL